MAPDPELDLGTERRLSTSEHLTEAKELLSKAHVHLEGALRGASRKGRTPILLIRDDVDQAIRKLSSLAVFESAVRRPGGGTA